MPTDEEVAEYFRRLKPSQMRNNPAVTEAGRAMGRLRKRYGAGPGRTPTVEHRPSPPRPRNWKSLSAKEKASWSRRNGGQCRCAECRRRNYPSYAHKSVLGKLD
jgi:hypothetical protein